MTTQHPPATTPHSRPNAVTEETVARLAEVLELCDEFFRTTAPTVRAELAFFLTRHPDRPYDAVGLVDMLGFNSRYLRAVAASARRRAATAPTTPTGEQR